MKLAEALIVRADSQKRIEQLKQRLQRNAKVQEGDAPAENPADLLAEIESLSAQLVELIQRINRTNAQTAFPNHGSIADAIAVRDVLRLRGGIYRELAQAATVTQERYSKSEVKFRSTIAVAQVQQQADQLAKEYRELDAAIQAANWLTDVLA